jgi:hypothetical protein
MSAVDNLAASQNGKLDPATATAQLEAMWDLGKANVSIAGARITGSGRDASCEIRLSNGETMVFEHVGDISTGGALPAELATCAGVAVKLNPLQKLQSIVLIRALAERQAAETADSIARDWGIDFLAICQQIEVDMNDQAERWATFERLQATDPALMAAETKGASIARYMLVPVDRSGIRYVRVGWFLAYVHGRDGAVGGREAVARMQRVGWTRRGTEGRIGARRPGLPGQVNLKFLLVAEGWEELPGEPVTAGNRPTRENDEDSRARVIGSTSGYRCGLNGNGDIP